MSPFEQVLSEVASDAAFDKRSFRKGDSAHLKRWLEDWRAAVIWQELHPGAFESHRAWSFIMTMLSLRQLAEQLDQANERVSEAKRARRKAARRDATKRLAELRTELSAQGIVLVGVRDGALDTVEAPEPFLADRERGTRRRTLFCRLASWYVRAETGRWHDEQVGALCEIALNCKDSVTADMVRHAREAGRRDATRKSRRKA
jgi:hypothetical protein